MRSIGNLTDEKTARAFGDFLVATGVRNQIEHETDGSWSVWVVDEDHITDAQTALARYRANPDAAEFHQAAATAAKVREDEAKDLAAYQRRVRTGRSLFPKIGGYGVGFLTYALIILCVVVAIYSGLGKDFDFLRHLHIVDPEFSRNKFLPEVLAGQVWRLFTPIFIHFGPIHLIFNMMWLYQLGSMIEGRQSAWRLALLVAGIALVSNFAQYYFHQPRFGGMSGVVYGLAGYVWMRGKYDHPSGLGLEPQSVTILLVWLVICYTGIVGAVANTAHLTGLILGLVWGRVSAYLASRKPE
jgi:GlpG protein